MANKPTPEQAWRSDYQIGYDNGVASQAAEIERLKGELAGKYKASPFGSKRNAALALYQPPFKFYRGYIYDDGNQVVADDDKVDLHIASQVRGWGRIGYMPDAAQLQDEVGAIIAEALTAFWAIQPKDTP